MPKDLEHFDERECGERNQDRLEPIEGRERLRFEDAVQERRVDHRDLEGHRCEHGDDQFRVREQADLPNRLARRSHREHEEELEEHDRREGDRTGSGGVGPLLQFQKENPEGADRQIAETTMIRKRMSRESTPSFGLRGGRSMMSVGYGSTPRARAGRPSVTRLIHRSCTGAKNGRKFGSAIARVAMNMIRTSPAFAERRKATNFRMFS